GGGGEGRLGAWPMGNSGHTLRLGCWRLTMRWVAICGVFAALAACAPQPAAKAAANPADGPGCLGVAAETCVRWLQASMNLDEGFIPAALARRHRVDVNGRPLDGGLITLTGKVPGRLDPMVI